MDSAKLKLDDFKFNTILAPAKDAQKYHLLIQNFCFFTKVRPDTHGNIRTNKP